MAPFNVHEAAEAVEEVRRVVRAGGGLGVVLHGEGRQPAITPQLEPLDDTVVEADVADGGLTEGSAGRSVQRRTDRESVVVRGDLDLAGSAVQDGLVDPP